MLDFADTCGIMQIFREDVESEVNQDAKVIFRIWKC